MEGSEGVAGAGAGGNTGQIAAVPASSGNLVQNPEGIEQSGQPQPHSH